MPSYTVWCHVSGDAAGQFEIDHSWKWGMVINHSGTKQPVPVTSPYQDDISGDFHQAGQYKVQVNTSTEVARTEGNPIVYHTIHKPVERRQGVTIGGWLVGIKESLSHCTVGPVTTATIDTNKCSPYMNEVAGLTGFSDGKMIGSLARLDENAAVSRGFTAFTECLLFFGHLDGSAYHA